MSTETERREDVAPGQARARHAGLHRRSLALSPELQRAVWPDEVVVAAQKLNVAAELVFASGVARRAPAQVRRALANGEVEALHERGVQAL